MSDEAILKGGSLVKVYTQEISCDYFSISEQQLSNIRLLIYSKVIDITRGSLYVIKKRRILRNSFIVLNQSIYI